MHRILVALLCAFDALIAAAVALAAVLAPLTLLWVFGLGENAEWSALWPASVAVWQLGNLVPLPVELPAEFLAQAGIASDAASFTLSLAPLAFAAFTAIFAARSGSRAAGAGAWITGALTGAIVYGGIAGVVALTASNPIVDPHLWQAVLFPVLLYLLAVLAGAVVAAWRGGDDGPIDRVRAKVDALPGGWAEVPALAVRSAAVALVAVIGMGAAALVVAVIGRGGEIVALFEAGHFDAIGATVVTLAQLAYLPNLVVWAVAWIAGPGFALGVGTAVSPAGTQLGVVPGIPILGIVPESVSSWLLLALLLPVAAGALAGWLARSRLVVRVAKDAEPDAAARPSGAPAGILPLAEPAPVAPVAPVDPFGPRIVVALAIGVLAGAGAALLAAVASGSIGPGKLALVGPSPGPVGLAVGLEVLVGAAILLLSPRAPERDPKPPRPRRGRRGATAPDVGTTAVVATAVVSTAPLTNAGPAPETGDAASNTDAPGPSDEPEPGHPAPPPAAPQSGPPPDPASLGPGRPAPLP